jgi:hypothetical protein
LTRRAAQAVQNVRLLFRGLWRHSASKQREKRQN